MNTFGPLVSPEWLAGHLDDPDLRVIDFRWYLDGRRGSDAYAAGHIPGAVFVDLDRVSGRADGPGRHPIPEPAPFASAMRAAGVSADDRVVAYDDASGGVAARLWWLLRHFGHRQVAVLDGGIQAWPGPLSTAAPEIAEGDFVARSTTEDTVDAAAVANRSGATVLLDARVGERYRGEVEPVDPRAGHIPGALSAPWTESIGPDGRMLGAAALRERFRGLGVGEATAVIAYCGSGVTASHALLAMEVAGLPPGILYEGSWSDWSSRPELPAAIGPEPGG